MKIKTVLASLLFATTLTACSKPDVTGVWIPEVKNQEARTYTYYEIKKMQGTDRLQFIRYYYSIRSAFDEKIPPSQLDSPRVKVLEFTKDNTYCVEGSLNTECVVSIDANTLDIYGEGRFKKSSSNPPKSLTD